jgi:hypothetical protein
MTLTELQTRTGYPLHELEDAASELIDEGEISPGDWDDGEWVLVLFRLLANQLGVDDVTAMRMAGAVFGLICKRARLH